MKNRTSKGNNYKRMAIIFASIFMVLNILIILFNNSYLENVTKKKEEEFVQIVTHMMQYEDFESTTLFIEHYSHVNNVEVILYDGDTIIYQTNDYFSGNSTYEIVVDGEFVGSVVLDFSNSVDREMNNDFIVFVNVIIVLAYIAIIIITVNTTKKNNNLYKIEIDNILKCLQKKKYKLVQTEFKEVAKKIDELHSVHENNNFDRLMYTHEIKTALMIILNNVESLKNSSIDENDKLIDEVKSEIFTINDYIEGVNNNIETEINVSNILNDHIKKHRIIMKTKDIALTALIESNLKLNISENDFTIIISNLLSNAFFYSNRGGKVSVSLKHDNTNIILVVEDNGIGVNSESIDVIFDENYRSKEAKACYKKGTGLGLYIVKELLEKSGNEIKVIKKDIGLKFIVKFKK